MQWNKPEIQRLLKAVLTINTATEARHFLRDLMTEGEIEEFAKRLKAAEMLAAKVPYTEIVKATGLSSTTVARVSKWLNGKEGGYRKILHRLHSKSASKAGR